jgi:hypothetical protein
MVGDIPLYELDAGSAPVGVEGALVLGGGELDRGHVGAVCLGQVDGVVAGPGADVQDAPTGEAPEDLGAWADSFPGGPVQTVWNGRRVGPVQLALTVGGPGTGVEILDGHGVSSASAIRIRCGC